MFPSLAFHNSLNYVLKSSMLSLHVALNFLHNKILIDNPLIHIYVFEKYDSRVKKNTNHLRPSLSLLSCLNVNVVIQPF